MEQTNHPPKSFDGLAAAAFRPNAPNYRQTDIDHDDDDDEEVVPIGANIPLNTIAHLDTTQPSSSSRARPSAIRSIQCQSSSDLLDEDWYRLDLTTTSEGTATDPITSKLMTSSKTKNESATADERDRFSPIHFPLTLPIVTAAVAFDNVENNAAANCRVISDCSRVSSKEEKQRQNEEIVIMESSSVSSETGSWESVFPQRTDAAEVATGTCDSFLNGERLFCTEATSMENEKSIADKLPSPKSPNERIPLKYAESELSITKPTTSCGACFIDASTLLDDGEIMFATNVIYQPKVQEISQRVGTAGDRRQTNFEQSPPATKSSCDCEPKEYFDIKTNTQRHNENDTAANVDDEKNRESGAEVNQDDADAADDSVINLSDEQKLNTKQTRDGHESVGQQQYDIKDQYASDNIKAKGPKPSPLNMLEISRNSSDRNINIGSGGDRHDHERKQGNFLFQNSIQQFSGHVMSPKMPYLEDNTSDFSLPSVYSGGSDPYTDCASAFDTSSHQSSNYGDRDSNDYGDLSHFSIGNSSSKADSVIYPGTPHNSILQVNLSRNSIAPSDSAIASLSSSESNCISIPNRARSHDDSMPIVSGEASVKDFTPKQCESPLMQRKGENCPIISVGMSSLDFDVPKSKQREKLSRSAMNAWVVDMSDCGNKNNKNRRRDSESSSISTESSRFSDSKVDRSGSGGSHKGLGFYVSLNDMKPPRFVEETFSKSLNYHSSKSACASAELKKKSTGFFVDFSNDSSHAPNTPPASRNVEQQRHPTKNDDKKNMFSMFIDFGADDRPPTPKRYNSTKSHPISTTSNELSDSPLLSRRQKSPLSSTAKGNNSENKRHSWSTSKVDTSVQSDREHKRSVSTSSEKGIMNISDKLPLISKTSSMSIDTPNSPYDDFTCSKSLSSCYSNNSLTSLSVHSSGGKIAEAEEKLNKRRQKDAKINETFDKSSQGSLTDGILSKTSTSPTSNTDTDDVTFQNDNNNDDTTIQATSTLASNVMETIPEKREAVVLRRPQLNEISSLNCSKVERHTMETLQATIEKQKQLLNTVSEEPSFVKLSDMDKPLPKFELHNADNRPKSVGSRIGKLFDNRAGNRNTWHHMSKSTGNNLSNLASSVENFKSLTRIFPHLGKDLSNSLPTNFEQTTSNSSPNDIYTMELFHSDLSTSSATSSFSRSGIDSADEFSLSAVQPRRLGEDLLKMFLQEIATDVVIEVNGRRMRAHKCILRSRCQYFAAILAGGWVESAGNVISLSGYSYGSVHFALCHIYSGASHPPEGISLMELAALADLLGLEGLKEVAAYSLKTNYCHSFHKPCSGCIDGVMQVFPVALNQGLDDLYRKCLRWACKHYMKVWPSRSFSQLPSELVARCKQHIIAHMTSESVIYTLLDCDHLLALLAPCRWATGIESNVRDIIEAAHIYVADHFASLIASDGFLSLGQGQSWNISRVENVLLRAGSSLSPDQACRSYQRITRLNSVLNAKINKLHTSRIDKSMFISDYDNEIDDVNDDEDDDELDWNPEFIRLVSEVLTAVEQCLVRQCSRAMKCNQWQRMDGELQKIIQKLACLLEPMERRVSSSRPKPIMYSPVITHNNRAQDLYQVKMAMQAHSKRSQEVHQSSKTTHMHAATNHEPKTIVGSTGKISKSTSRAHVPDLISTTLRPTKTYVPIKTERKPTTANTASAHRRSASETNKCQITKDKSSSSVDSKLKKNNGLYEVKSRYLEPLKKRQNEINKETLKVRTMSSSGSSRTSSPVIQARHKEGTVAQSNRKALSDSITMSRDSLASPAKKNDKSISSKTTSLKADHERLSADSLGGSLHSSVISTNKTISQESLVTKMETRKPTELNSHHKSLIKNDHHPVHSENKRTVQLQSHQKPLRQYRVTGTNAQLKVCTAIISHTPSVTSSTPSSVTVKSRLSGSNSINSPRDTNITKNRLTTPAHPLTLASQSSAQKTTAKKSFLSARSRQILAQKKSTSLSHSESTKSVPATIKDVATNNVNKSSSASNILNRRANNNLSITLHVSRRSTKTNSLPPSSANASRSSIGSASTTSHNSLLMNPTKSSTMKTVVAQNNKMNREQHSTREKGNGKMRAKSTTANTTLQSLEHADHEEHRKHEHQSYNDSSNSTAHKNYSDRIIDTNSMNNSDGGDLGAPIRIESKLERSSTFCKERSDIPTSELQIID